ncbi:MAG: hypothetical protein IJL87_06930 [Clostridia bacterium]|nr:hypothetical protein [Clostridia bacterium]
MKTKSTGKKILIAVLAVLLAFILIVGAYVAYVFIDYRRIPDNQPIEIEGSNTAVIPAEKELTAICYNIGYGSYPPDYTFFMDGGKESVARSEDSVKTLVDSAAKLAAGYKPDIAFFQEVDTDSTRSLHIDEYSIIKKQFKNYSSVYALNYDSPFLFYPFTKPIGKSVSGIATFAKYKMEGSVRYSLPIDNGFKKLIDLDRCFTVTRLPVSNGKTLYLYNVHLSAYGVTSDLFDRQLAKLYTDMEKIVAGGDYIICAGDYNHDFTGDSLTPPAADSERLEWQQPFPEDTLPKGMRLCKDLDNDPLVLSNRTLDVPAGNKDSVYTILDGFIVSDNVECVTVSVVDNKFEFSDHNPVLLKFILK